MNGENFEPSPELQAEIDAALEAQRRTRQDPNWTPKRGVVLNVAAINARQGFSAALGYSLTSCGVGVRPFPTSTAKPVRRRK